MYKLLPSNLRINGFVAVMALLGLSGCMRTPEWTLFYQTSSQGDITLVEDEASLLKHEYIQGYYDTLEQCQAKGAGMVKLSGIDDPHLNYFSCAQLCQSTDKNEIQCQQSVSQLGYLQQLN